ncbi:TraR/DksA family transcriptional regulator [Streptomyces sp. NRRL B-24720]|uniref:TraR/DksA family transcriptional regulator n=1 Tax=Streptomyces sp. NRRL B-24720 TaxID=1476876 RepID=UPI001F2C4ED6|nr:TraR/DksA C4-type zinc finger protein [Streptomyces sp. NRRL B-24720]
MIIVSAKEPGHDSIDRLGSESPLPDVEGFRRRLARQAAALRRQIADAPSRQEELRADCLLDAADVGSATAALAQHDVETDNAARLLTRVEGALVRLKDGSYGNCLQCGEAIDWERLRALPHLERCLRCESGKDGGLR